MGQEGAKQIIELLPGYHAPDDAGSVYRKAVCFLQPKPAARTMDGYLALSDLLRRRAESKMQIGEALPEVFASAPRMRNASISRLEKSLALAIAQGNLEISAVARQLRRLSGPCEGAACQGVLAATARRRPIMRMISLYGLFTVKRKRTAERKKLRMAGRQKWKSK